MSIRLEYENNEIQVKIRKQMFFGEILEYGCRHFDLTCSEHELQVVKTKKSVDLSTTVAFARLPHGCRLMIVSRKVPVIGSVNVRLQCASRSELQGKFDSSTTLWAMLCEFEQKNTNSRSLTKWYGIPEPEKGELFELVINVPGYMQPVVHYMNRRFDTIEQLKNTTFMTLGLYGSGVGAKMRLTHKYQAPEMSRDEQQAAIDRFNNAYRKKMTSASPQSCVVGKVAEKKKILVPERQTVVLWCEEGSGVAVDNDSDDEDFYTPSAADSLMYAQSILQTSNPQLAKKHSERQQQSSKPSMATDTTRIRVKFSQHMKIEGHFNIRESVADVQSWIQSCFETPLIAGRLATTPPLTLLKSDASLFDLGLHHASILHYVPHNEAVELTPTALIENLRTCINVNENSS